MTHKQHIGKHWGGSQWQRGCFSGVTAVCQGGIRVDREGGSGAQLLTGRQSFKELRASTLVRTLYVDAVHSYNIQAKVNQGISFDRDQN